MNGPYLIAKQDAGSGCITKGKKYPLHNGLITCDHDLVMSPEIYGDIWKHYFASGEEVKTMKAWELPSQKLSSPDPVAEALELPVGGWFQTNNNPDFLTEWDSAPPTTAKKKKASSLPAVSNPRPFTQKAKSIRVCREGSGYVGLHKAPGPVAILPGTSKEFPELPAFARPCPTKPRHGFVDSRRVDNWFEVCELLNEATRCDEEHNAELAIMPLMTGRFSGLATNSGVVWGLGNDGVTGGTDKGALTIPVPTTPAAWQRQLENAFVQTGIPSGLITDTAYLEIVEHNGVARAVQLRDGPAQQAGTDYIPRRMKVGNTITPKLGEGLLEWEERVKVEHAADPNLVIHAPGYALSSHYAVHGIERGIPVITASSPPSRGTTIRPTTKNPPRLTATQCRTIAKLLRTAMETEALAGGGGMHWSEAVVTALATIHAQAFWGWKQHLLGLRAVSIAILLRAVTAACLGELRYWNGSSGPKGNGASGSRIEDRCSDVISSDRCDIYERIMARGGSAVDYEIPLTRASELFDHEGWESGYGGYKWEEVASNGAALAKATRAFLDDPTPQTWSAVFNAANVLVNTAHNNGKCLNKFLRSSRVMDWIAACPTVGFLNSFAGHHVLGLPMDNWRNRKDKR